MTILKNRNLEIFKILKLDKWKKELYSNDNFQNKWEEFTYPEVNSQDKIYVRKEYYIHIMPPRRHSKL